MSYGAITLNGYPDIIIADLTSISEEGGKIRGRNWAIHVPPFPDLDYEGWTLSVSRDRVANFKETTEDMALAYLRHALPPLPDLTRRDWRGKVKLNLDVNIERAYLDYKRNTRGSALLSEEEFFATVREFMKDRIYDKA